MSISSYLLLVLVLLVTCEADPTTESMEASDGGTASLPCNLTPIVTPDKISVVLWYKGEDESPIYKYDLRGSQPVRWADPVLQNRYFLRILDDNRAAMSISPTRLSDEYMFHCRVDFLKSPTRITNVNLTIIGSIQPSPYTDTRTRYVDALFCQHWPVAEDITSAVRRLNCQFVELERACVHAANYDMSVCQDQEQMQDLYSRAEKYKIGSLLCSRFLHSSITFKVFVESMLEEELEHFLYDIEDFLPEDLIRIYKFISGSEVEEEEA